ncbi:hypothetical protein OG943_04175 [Amycolatopsis sp. NBC_00345]|uniref:LGFP repeat-containing protein n=1 Tax=Amycolatopsis sp. NBC_00345 TaxID=2975955 RepID=UPI002E254A4F
MKTALRIILTAAALASGMFSATSTATAAPAACTFHSWSGLIGDRYNTFGGLTGVLGCPTTDERDVSEGHGRIQYFQNGVITSSPTTGPSSVETLWNSGAQLSFDWYTTAPLNYDVWLLNVRFNGTDRGLDRELPAISGTAVGRSSGRTTIGFAGSGNYRVAIEGCDLGGGHTCRQGWTNPLYLSL